MREPDKTGQEQAGRFPPGQSGNPKGRPTGSRSKVLLALDALGEKEAESIVSAMIEKAKGGDANAGRAILDRVWPPRKGARLQFDLPDVREATELPGAIAAVNRQVAEGGLAPEEASLIVGLLDAQRRALETSELAERITAIEQRMAGNKR